MSSSRQTIIFDTSAINALEGDKDRVAVVRGTEIACSVAITGTVISEIVAHSDEVGRRALLNLLKQLLSCGRCIQSYQDILEKQAQVYQRDPAGFDWRQLEVGFPAAEDEIARQEFIHSISDEQRASQKQANKDFKNIFVNARPAFQSIFNGDVKRLSLQEVSDILVADGGAHLGIGANLVAHATGKRPTDSEFKAFMECCPPYKALIMALCFTQYELCIRNEREQSLGKAGMFDMFSAVYLPYCDVFVTNDNGQFKALSSVIELSKLDVSIMSYCDFRRGLFGLSD